MHLKSTKMNKIKLEYICEYYANGQLVYEVYRLNGKLHNPNGPAYRSWHENGQLEYEEYRLNGKLHNPNGPAVRGWHENGQLWYERYWLNGKRHNPNGPALRSWHENGELRYEEYYLNGKELTKEQFEDKMNKPSCADRIVVIDGVEYKLTPVEK
jgi:antitoxin component YwqK of YwqJK toxin-antitoxin module